MVCIQTYWSLPSQHNKEDDLDGRNSGGWLHEKYHAYSWALSCLKFAEFYPENVLYADANGADWLINKLKLPYHNVVLNLEDLNGYPPNLWALPKIYVYGQQKKPFFHADGDVFIWKRFDSYVEQSELFVQNIEINNSYYADILNQVRTIEGFHAPLKLPEFLSITVPVKSVNAGIIGGSNVDFFSLYSSIAFDFVRKNLAKLALINMRKFNTVFEQLLFYRLAQKLNKKIAPVFESVDEKFTEVLQINTVPMLSSYIHAVGNSKKNPMICLELEARLKYEFPKIYRHISSLYRDDLKIPVSKMQDDRFAVNDQREFLYTRRLLLREFQNIPGDMSVTETRKKINKISRQASHSDAELLLLDIYQIEKSYQSLMKRQTGISGNILLSKIQAGLPYLYSMNAREFLDQPFQLDRNHCDILCLFHQFEDTFSDSYLNKIVRQEIRVSNAETPIVFLTEIYDRKIGFRRLEDWDLLLYYFEDNILTGNQLINLLQTEGCPFDYNHATLADDVIKFFVTNALFHRRLKFK